MLSHAVPSPGCAPASSSSTAEARMGRACSRAEGPSGGSISLEFHPPLRRQGADLDPRAVPPGAGQGRLRRRLRPSVAGCACARLRRQRADRRDRRALADDAPLFAVPRRVRNGASGHERGPAPGRRGAGVFRGTAEDRPRAWARGGVRRPGAQVPDLGARALPGPSRSGARARSAPAGGARRARRPGRLVTSPAAAPHGLGHVPVLLTQAMEALAPREGGLYVDGTFGGGGYARALLERGARVIALDRDPSAIAAGETLKASAGGRLELVEARFGELDAVAKDLGADALDGV